MFLEQLKEQHNLSDAALSIINLIISQLNFLLCLVNDVLAMKQIEQNKYTPQVEKFSPLALLEYIVAIFQSQSDMQKLPLSYETISFQSNSFALESSFNPKYCHKANLPAQVSGD